jgi:hypothetical protein
VKNLKEVEPRVKKLLAMFERLNLSAAA